MCLGIPGQIITIPDDRADVARVSVAGRDRDIQIGLIEGPPLAPGDWILIHLGFALERMTEAEAKDTIALLAAEESALEPLDPAPPEPAEPAPKGPARPEPAEPALAERQS